MGIELVARAIAADRGTIEYFAAALSLSCGCGRVRRPVEIKQGPTMSQAGGYRGPLEQAGPCQWRIPKSYRADMRVDGIIFADDKLIEQIKKDQGPEQVVNVATLPGIQKASLAMPDIHWGYGFCIGGVAATDPEEGGVISPGGVGYDINCGVRLLEDQPGLGRRQGPDPGRWSINSSAISRPASVRAGATCSTSRS